VLVSISAILIIWPALLIAILLIFFQDWKNPFYCPWRIGQNGRKFRLLKLRTMYVGADLSKVDSTKADDPRITPAGRFIRGIKLDELPQFFNVLRGEMSVVGPRPNIERETNLYTEIERRMLLARPGITDIASITFADLAEILAGSLDANIAYNQLVRPWKSRLALFYCDHASLKLDIQLICLTALNPFNRKMTLRRIHTILTALKAPADLSALTLRNRTLEPVAPPGLESIVTDRQT
jgi:lipopolysaccharide/colanic/teichoic acid biosynthesis glycosyltransferase